MASSNRHWPSLFKSKPCNTHPHQWQHDVSPNSSLVSNGCLRTSPFPPSGVGGGDKEERSPEPKPRWNPKPEQIRILEAIFNSGLVNPPRDEIRKIRAQLQEYGNVGDANVFYWFQNRKSRSKNKHRHRHLLHHNHHSPPSSAPSPTSSSSSDNNNNKPASSTLTDLTTNGNIILGSAGGGNNNYSYATSADFFSTDNNAQFMFQGGGGVVAPTYSEGSSSMGFSELSNVVSSGGPSTNVILTELMMKDHHQAAAKMKMETQLMMSTYNTTTVSSASPNHTHITTPPSTATALHVPPPINLSQGVEEQGEMEEERPMILVFINDVAFQVCAGPFNLREAFGGDVVLFHSSGQPVLTNEWGDSLSSLQHGASYYLYYVEACQWEMKMDSINI